MKNEKLVTGHRGDVDLVNQLAETLDAVGLYISVAVNDRELNLTGEVETEGDHQAGLDLARPIANRLDLRIDDNITVLMMEPDATWDEQESEQQIFSDESLNPGLHDESDPLALEPSFTAELGTSDSEEAAAGAVPYFPPTDPVAEPTTDFEQLQIIGGFEGTSMDPDPADEDESVTVTPRFNDDEIAGDILRELRQDAITTDFRIHISVRSGQATLTGTVPTIEDAEQVEAIVAGVPGVIGVREKLDIATLADLPPRSDDH